MSENCLIMYYERLEQYTGVLCNNSDNLPIGLTIHNGHCSYNSNCFQNNTKPLISYFTRPYKMTSIIKSKRGKDILVDKLNYMYVCMHGTCMAPSIILLTYFMNYLQSIYIQLGKITIPRIFAFLPNKSEAAYHKVFCKVEELVKLSPVSIICDF